jgi:hypothetical protein
MELGDREKTDEEKRNLKNGRVPRDYLYLSIPVMHSKHRINAQIKKKAARKTPIAIATGWNTPAVPRGIFAAGANECTVPR